MMVLKKPTVVVASELLRTVLDSPVTFLVCEIFALVRKTPVMSKLEESTPYVVPAMIK